MKSYMEASDDTEDLLINLCADWQKRLRLQDWNITLKLVTYGDIEAAGCCSQDRYKNAVIKIARHGGTPEKWLVGTDYEETLVHELLHLYTEGFDRKLDENSAEERAMELMVERLSVALVNLKRGECRA